MALQTDRDKVAHLLRRFGFGASEAELDYYAQGGVEAAIDRLLNFVAVEEGFEVPLDDLRQPNGNINVRVLQMWWLLRMVATRRPLQEKLTLFWHDHFATSAAKVDVVPAMHAQNETLRAGCAARFEDLLTQVSKDPAMLYWLDNQLNVKGKPNENFAREVMELFTLGVGNYSEKDVQEAARAFTGWDFGSGPRGLRREKPIRGARFVFRPLQHDDGPKEVLGNKGRFGGEDVIGILCGHPRTPIYLATKMWEWFAYPNPDPKLVDRLAKRFRDSGLEIKALVRAIMESPEFFSPKAARAVYKTPLDFCVSTLRQLGYGRRVVEALAGETENKLRRLAPMAVVHNATKAMGMEVFFPPDVAGWEGGASWISSATMVERIKWADRLFAAPAAGSAPARRVPSLNFPAATLFDSSDPAAAARALASVFDADLPAAKMRQLEAAAREASGGTVDARSAGAVALAVCRLIFGSPEFQMA